MGYKYKTIVVGGTFDTLHAGHAAFLRYAFSLAGKVYVTITSDTYTHIHKPYVASFREREKHVKEFLEQENVLSRATLVPINNVYGITSEHALSLEAILVTDDTLQGAGIVNEKRKGIGLPPLAIVVMPRIFSEVGLPLSSTYIRQGIVDSGGNLQLSKQVVKSVSYMPDILRKQLQQPFGELVTQENIKNLTKQKLIAVGDVTTQVLHKNGLVPLLSVIDFRVERKKQPNDLQALGFIGSEVVHSIVNPPSTLTPQLWESLSLSFQEITKDKKVIVIVTGEEDLAVLPAVLLAPEGYVICYGQPHVGMIVVVVNTETKQYALQIISRFTRASTRGH